ncbi:MAG: transcription antitermination factor NusB [Bacteroidales bacterium]|nr:transcription antitermination factor NusB [Bacteroidales bacterium]MCF6342149.1 transcription antitermination factor NusB [Bacteroidales bacterium]
MLYRRHLRIKVLQALYSWYSGVDDDQPKAEKELLAGINKLFELFVWQLAFLLEVRQFAKIRIGENKQKFYPTDDDLNPNLKFVNNRALALLEQNKDFQNKLKLFKVKWTEQQETMRKFYSKLRASDFFKKYLDSRNTSLDEDKKLMIKVVDLLLSDFDLLKSWYEEKSVYFTDGYDLVNILLIKFFDTISDNFGPLTTLPTIFTTENAAINDDRDFVVRLFREVLRSDETTTEIIKGKTKNWDYERIPLMDVILLRMAIVELQMMDTIPVKVTLNEYIEMAKFFSTPKSKVFVNGILDNLIREFKEEGKINKSGRGLKE